VAAAGGQARQRTRSPSGGVKHDCTGGGDGVQHYCTSGGGGGMSDSPLQLGCCAGFPSGGGGGGAV